MFRRGDVVYLRDYTELPIGEHIQNKKRPLLIVSNDKQNKYSPVLLVVPLTTNFKRLDLACHVIVGEKSMALCEQVMPIMKNNIVRVSGHVGDMSKVNNGLSDILSL